MTSQARKLLCMGVVVSLVALLCLMTGGCTNQTREANRLINEFNTHIAKYNKLDKEAAELMKSLNTAAKSEDEFRKNVEILGQVESKITGQLEELTEGSKSLEEAKDLNISSDFKTYINMEQEANEAGKELCRLTKEVATELKKMYEAMSSPPGLSQSQLDEKKTTISRLNREVTEQTKKAEELKSKANNYYKDHKLGK